MFEGKNRLSAALYCFDVDERGNLDRSGVGAVIDKPESDFYKLYEIDDGQGYNFVAEH